MLICKFHELVNMLCQFLPSNPIIVEAGAFNGADTMRLKKLFPQGVIHAFEPVPELYQKLVKMVSGQEGIFTYSYALSDTVGMGTLWVAYRPHKPHTPSQASSLLAPAKRLDISSIEFSSTIDVPTITLDAWAQKYHIDQVDFVWLDIQGMELAVMQSSVHTMKNVKVALVEVAFQEGYKQEPLHDELIAWMEQQGFVPVARDFETVHDSSNVFFGNVLFVRR